ncbi:hypothetical protein MNEG_15761, partial [Monoraphidium neglectum]
VGGPAGAVPAGAGVPPPRLPLPLRRQRNLPRPRAHRRPPSHGPERRGGPRPAPRVDQ